MLIFKEMRVKYTKSDIENAVSTSKSWAGVCRILGIKPFTGSQSHLKKRAVNLNIDYSHFTGQGHRLGIIGTFSKPIGLYLNNTFKISSYNLKIRLFSEGIKHRICEDCNLSEWMGKSIPLELHHCDGDHYNNELSNLKILCPNCHAAIGTRIGNRSKKTYIPRITHYCSCGKGISGYVIKHCLQCSRLKKRRVDRPSICILKEQISEFGYVGTGRIYGVSDNAIRKWLK